MIELTTTRANHLVDPTVHVWAWQIPIYLFLGGLVAGLMVLAGWMLWTERHRRAESAFPAFAPLALALLSAGMLALFLDLEHKLFVWRLYTTFEPASPMSWGAWILLLVYPVLALLLLLRPVGWLAPFVPKPLSRLGESLDASPRARRALAIAAIAGGVALGIYTGILLSSLGARPLWASGLLGPLFLTSGLSSAAALAHLLAHDEEEQRLLGRADAGFLGGELALLVLFLIGLTTATRVHAAAAGLLLGGPYTAPFWVGVVGLGIVVPLVVAPIAQRRGIHTVLPSLFVLAGGLALRFVMVFAGQASHWSPF